jgi:adenylate kinase family enzyme
LITRSDDSPETIIKRLATYHKTIDPLLKIFGNKVKVIDNKDGKLEIKEVSENILKVLSIQ